MTLMLFSSDVELVVILWKSLNVSHSWIVDKQKQDHVI